MDQPSETFEWATVTADALAALFPRLGLFAADDVVAFRDLHGAFPDAATIATFGVELGLAEQICLGAAGETHDDGALPASGPLDDSEPAEAVDPLERFRVRPDAPPPPGEDAGEPTVQADETQETLPIETDEVGSAAFESVERSPGPPPLPAAAVSESALSTKAFPTALRSSLQAPAIVATEERPAVVPPPKARRIAPAALVILATCNLATLVGMGLLTMDGRRARAPVAALSAEVSGLQVEGSGFRARIDGVHDKLEGTRADIDDVRGRLDRHERALAATIETVDANATRQKAFEREAKARDAREEREMNALKGRVSGVERRVDHVYTLKEALQVIDRVHGEP